MAEITEAGYQDLRDYIEAPLRIRILAPRLESRVAAVLESIQSGSVDSSDMMWRR